MTSPPTLLRALAVAGALVAGASTALAAGKAHEHGVLRLDVGVDAGGYTLLLNAPLDSLVGFERAPRTEGERARVAQALERLKVPARLFRIDANAQCDAGRVNLSSDVLGLGGSGGAAQGGAAKGDGHAELDAEIRFDCRAAAAATQLEHTLFDAFPRTQRLEVQIATPKGQARRVLRRPAARIELPR